MGYWQSLEPLTLWLVCTKVFDIDGCKTSWVVGHTLAAHRRGSISDHTGKCRILIKMKLCGAYGYMLPILQRRKQGSCRDTQRKPSHNPVQCGRWNWGEQQELTVETVPILLGVNLTIVMY